MTSALIFTYGAQQIVFYALYAAWLLSEIIGATLVPRLRFGPRTGVKRDRGSFYVNIIMIIFAISVDFFLSRRGSDLPGFVYYVGIAFMLIGLVLRQWAVAVLGRFFTLTVRVQSDHKIVEAGPYRFVRHPSYTGLLFLMIGISLALQTLEGFFINLVVFGLVFGYRIYLEEHALLNALGDEYRSYSKRTKRLIPYVL